jgi:HAD superfamily hydrolase (TIGR01459 family)
MAEAKGAVPILLSIEPLAAECEAWIVDVWGVIHNGVKAFPAACDACRKMRARGGVVVLVSNAPRPFSALIPLLDGLGVKRDAYDTGVTSGDVTRDMIEGWQGHRVFHIGPERDKGLFDGFDVRFAGAEDAEVVVCSGLFDDTRETPDDYRATFELLLARRVPMICANPDIRVERGEELVYCAGALAALYESRGGSVVYAGKPHLPIYDRVFAAIERVKGRPVPRQRIISIGDGIETDLLGAHHAGVRSVFIASGIHVTRPLDEHVLGKLFVGRAYAPIAAMPALAW